MGAASIESHDRSEAAQTPSVSQDVPQPQAEVPSQFKSIVRRSQKVLLRKTAPELATAYNEFIAALNAGAPAEDLENLGDDLEDAYHDAR